MWWSVFSFNVNPGDIVRKLQKRSRLNHDIVRKRFSSPSLEISSSTSSSSEELPNSPDNTVDAGEQFLFEVGGNIGWSHCMSLVRKIRDIGVGRVVVGDPKNPFLVSYSFMPEL